MKIENFLLNRDIEMVLFIVYMNIIYTAFFPYMVIIILLIYIFFIYGNTMHVPTLFPYMVTVYNVSAFSCYRIFTFSVVALYRVAWITHWNYGNWTPAR